MSAPGGAALPQSIRYVPEDPQRVRVTHLPARFARRADAPEIIGTLIGRNWLGGHAIGCRIALAGGVELICPPACVVPAPEPSDNVIMLAGWRGSC
jgi:hypothetical protein